MLRFSAFHFVNPERNDWKMLIQKQIDVGKMGANQAMT